MFLPYIRHAWIWLFIFFVFRYNQEMTAAHRDVHRINWAFEGRRWPCYWKIKKRIINRTHTEKFNSTYEIENIDRKIVYVSFAHSNACDVMSVAAACSMSQSTCCTAARIHRLSLFLCVCVIFSPNNREFVLERRKIDDNYKFASDSISGAGLWCIGTQLNS